MNVGTSLCLHPRTCLYQVQSLCKDEQTKQLGVQNNWKDLIFDKKLLDVVIWTELAKLAHLSTVGGFRGIHLASKYTSWDVEEAYWTLIGEVSTWGVC